jgi:hypothetical protein
MLAAWIRRGDINGNGTQQFHIQRLDHWTLRRERLDAGWGMIYFYSIGPIRIDFSTLRVVHYGGKGANSQPLCGIKKAFTFDNVELVTCKECLAKLNSKQQ